MLRVSGSVGHCEKSAVGVADQRELFECEIGADGFEISHLSFHGLRRVGLQMFGSAGATLVVEDDESRLGYFLPHVVLEHVDMREAGAAVHGDDGDGSVAPTEGFVTELDLLSGD